MALLDPITNAPKNQKIALGVMACVVGIGVACKLASGSLGENGCSPLHRGVC